MATEWALPTRPSGLDALITSGIQGTRGQMVDVTITTIKHQIRDSKGELLTDVVLSPTKSQSRTTTARGGASTAPANPPQSAGLSSGAKAGIGAGVGIAGAIALLAAGLFLVRRRRKSKATTVEEREKNAAGVSDSSDGFTSINQYKAELATGPDVEAQPLAELPDKGVATPGELAGRQEYPGIGTIPVELPVHEPALEMPNPQARNQGN
jgi:hypothetical protein